jgi:ribosomal protein S18 acetylase RimI-like enzyme
MEVAHEVFKEQSSENLEENNGIWLETDRENLPAINLYKAFGYSEVAESNEGRVLMTYNIK